MSGDLRPNEQAPAWAKQPKWVGYAFAVALVGAVLAVLVAMEPVFPLGNYPITLVIPVMAAAYLFGEGPALLTFALGLAAYLYFFAPPGNQRWPAGFAPESWAGVVAFLLGMIVVGSATLMMRKSRMRIQALADQLGEAKDALERDYEREHHIAETLQTSILTPLPKRMGALAIETVYRAALEEARIGGDFYDAFRIDDDRVGFVIGDVSGKGLAAAVQVAAAKYSLRSRAFDSGSPAMVMGQVNRALTRDADIESFVTLFYGMFDFRTRTLVYANAGHTPAVLLRASDPRSHLLEPTGCVVGVDTESSYTEESVELNVGDEILLGTDGIYEVWCKGEFLDMGGMLELLAALRQEGTYSAPALVDRIVEYCAGNIRDDIAVLRVSVIE